jgi:hypothetical protein
VAWLTLPLAVHLMSGIQYDSGGMVLTFPGTAGFMTDNWLRFDINLSQHCWELMKSAGEVLEAGHYHTYCF